MAFTIKIQSPSYNNAGAGTSISLPVAIDSHQGNSLAQIIPLFQGNNAIMDFGQLSEIVSLTGVLTQKAATEAGYANPVHLRDALRAVRSGWPVEAAAGNWGDASLPADERDASTTRGTGKARLIFDKKWDAGGASFLNFFLYGTVADFSFGPRAAASGRVRIPFRITFLVGSVKSGV